MIFESERELNDVSHNWDISCADPSVSNDHVTLDSSIDWSSQDLRLGEILLQSKLTDWHNFRSVHYLHVQGIVIKIQYHNKDNKDDIS